jgi:hypothetical protein
MKDKYLFLNLYACYPVTQLFSSLRARGYFFLSGEKSTRIFHVGTVFLGNTGNRVGELRVSPLIAAVKALPKALPVRYPRYPALSK